MEAVEEVALAPKKGNYRQRAHCNPLADACSVHPAAPEYVQWKDHFPNEENKNVLKIGTTTYPLEYPTQPVHPDPSHHPYDGPHFLDIGCGYGGLSLRLAELYQNKRILGMEIRSKVAEFVGLRIRAGRNGTLPPLPPIRPDSYVQVSCDYRNVSVIRQNSMKFLPHYIPKGVIEKLFFCFPDPHFKRSKWRWRIINPALLAQYRYIMKKHGRLYTVTDCLELHVWMKEALQKQSLFKLVYESELPEDNVPRHAYDPDAQNVLQNIDEKKKEDWEQPWVDGTLPLDDPVIPMLTWTTEEAQKVLRSKMTNFINVYEAVDN